MAPRAGEQLGPYAIPDKLGASGMGEVYRARDPRRGRDVVLVHDAVTQGLAFKGALHRHVDLLLLHGFAPYEEMMKSNG